MSQIFAEHSAGVIIEVSTVKSYSSFGNKYVYEDDVFEISGDMCTNALEALKTSSGVIIDHVITSERIFRQLTAMLGQYHIHSVHVTCPLNVLLQREYARKNRCLGSAESSYTYLFPKDEYDLTVDTFIMTPAECSAKIYGALL